jgi:hypothetical protein
VNYINADNENENEIADDWFDIQSGIKKKNEIMDILYNKDYDCRKIS